ncbi:MAG TPA: hypothetical protein VGA75_04070 [Paracoccaceae bacterium]
MFIGAVLAGTVLGYIAAGLALILGFSFWAALLTLVCTGMATVLLLSALALLHRPAETPSGKQRPFLPDAA